MVTKKNTIATHAPVDDPDIAANIVDTPISQYLREKQFAYMLYVSTDRAIPLAASGVKPGLQRLLQSMKSDKVLPGSKPRKSAKLTSSATGSYHPHGQASMYGTMVTAAAPYSRLPLIEGIGSFGAFPGDDPAADRYTEARLSPAGYELVREIDQGAVPMRRTYDNERDEVWYLPARFPALLMVGAVGIGEGWATTTPAHNPREVIAAALHVLDHPDATVDDIMQHMPGPDWGTGGAVVGDMSGVRKYFETGRGKFTVRCTYRIEGKKIFITEVPPNVRVDTLLNGNKGEGSRPGLKDMARQNVIPGIADVSDLSDFNGMSVVIDVKRGHDPEQVMAEVLQQTDLEHAYAASLVALDRDFGPRWWSVRELLDEFLEVRDGVVVRKSQHELEGLEAKLARQRALTVVALDKELVAKIILDSEDKAAAVSQLLVRKFGFSDGKAYLFDAEESFIQLDGDQAEYVVSMPLYRLTKADSLEALARLENMVARRDELLRLLSDAQLRRKVVRDDLVEVSKIFDGPEFDRKTVLLPEVSPAVSGASELTDQDRFYASWKFDVDSAAVGEVGEKIPEGSAVWAVLEGGKVKRFVGDGLPLNVRTKPITSSAQVLFCGVDFFDEGRSLFIVTRGTNKSSSAKLLRLDLSKVRAQGVAGNGVAGIRLLAGDDVAAAFVAGPGDEVLLMSEGSFKVLGVDGLSCKGTNTQGLGVFKLRGSDSGVYRAVVGRGFTVNGEAVEAGSVAKTPVREAVESYEVRG